MTSLCLENIHLFPLRVLSGIKSTFVLGAGLCLRYSIMRGWVRLVQCDRPFIEPRMRMSDFKVLCLFEERRLG
jgi:hypothetical protein